MTQWPRQFFWPAVLLAACSEDGTGATRAGLVLRPSVLNFELTPVHAEVRAEVELENRSGRVLGDLRAEIDPALLSAIAVFGLPASLPIGATHRLTVVFAPELAGTFSGLLLVRAADLIAEMRVLANAAAPGLFFTENPLHFGLVPLGESRTATAWLTNGGPAPVEIRAIVRDPSSHFDFVLGLPSTVTLSPAESIPLLVTIRPEQAGLRQAHWLVNTDPPSAKPPALEALAQGIDGLLEVVPRRADFGNVPLQAMRSRSVLVRNLTADAVSLLRFERFGSDAFSNAPLALPLDIPPGEARLVEIRFSPRTRGHHLGSLALDFSVAVVTIALAGDGIQRQPPILRLAESLDFGTVSAEISIPVTRELFLENGGDEPLLWGFGPADPVFSATSAGVRRSLAPRDQARIDVSFAPPGSGEFQGSLLIDSNDPDRPTAGVAIFARAQPGPTGDLRIAPDRLNFHCIAGKRAIGLENHGNAPLTISELRFVGGGVFATSQIDLPAQIDPRARLSFLVEAIGGGGRDDVLFVESDDPDPAAPLVLTSSLASAGALGLELYWTGPVDLDLHLVAAGGTLFDVPSDTSRCHDAGNLAFLCAEGLSGAVEQQTLNPERIAIDPQFVGPASVFVVHRAGTEASFALVTLLVGGAPQKGAVTRALPPEARWEVGTLWGDGAGGLSLTGAESPLVVSAEGRCD